MDPNAPRNVLINVFLVSITGLGIGASYGAIKKTRPGPLVMGGLTAMNSGAVGLVFFACREYVVSPMLVRTLPWSLYERRKMWSETERKDPFPQPASYAEMRSQNITDTALAASMVGALFNTVRRGPAGIIPGIITASLITTSLQFLFNEADVLRVKYISRSKGIEHPFGNQLLVRPHSVQTDADARSLPERIMDGIAKVFPVTKMTDEEYLEKLKKQRSEIEQKLERVRRQLKEVEEQTQAQDSNSPFDEKKT